MNKLWIKFRVDCDRFQVIEYSDIVARMLFSQHRCFLFTSKRSEFKYYASTSIESRLDEYKVFLPRNVANKNDIYQRSTSERVVDKFIDSVTTYENKICYVEFDKIIMDGEIIYPISEYQTRAVIREFLINHDLTTEDELNKLLPVEIHVKTHTIRYDPTTVNYRGLSTSEDYRWISTSYDTSPATWTTDFE